MIFRTAFVFLASLLLINVCCSRHPLVNLDSSAVDTLFSFKEKNTQRIRGFGQLTFSIDGRRYNGSVEIDCKNDLFKASAYSPFGALVASIDADSLQGEITDGKTSNRFFLDAIADSLLFIPTNDLTFRDFIYIMTGRLPRRFNRLAQQPDTIFQGKRNSSLIWRADSLEIIARVHNKSSKLTRLTVQNNKKRGWKLLFDAINEQLAQSIELRVDDRNYFSIHYQRLKKETLKSL